MFLYPLLYIIKLCIMDNSKNKEKLTFYESQLSALTKKFQLGGPRLDEFEEVQFIKICIELKKDGKIEDYINGFCKYRGLSERAESELISSNNDDIIKFYLSKHELCVNAQFELVDKGSKELLLFYMRRYDLSTQVWRYLVVKLS